MSLLPSRSTAQCNDDGVRVASAVTRRFALIGVISVVGIPCTSLRGSDVQGLTARGAAEREAGRGAPAVQLLREAVRISPNDLTARIELARALAAVWEARYTEDDLKGAGRSLWLAPKDWRAHGLAPWRWSVLGEEGIPSAPAIDESLPGEVTQMREHADAAIEIAPADPRALAIAGCAAAMCRERDRATELFAEALRSGAQDGLVSRLCAMGAAGASRQVVYTPNGIEVKFEPRAKGGPDYVKVLEEAVRASPDDVNLRVVLANMRFMNGDVETAERDIESVLKNDRDNFHAHFTRGETSAHVGAYERSASEFVECIRIRPNATLPRLQLSWLRAHSGDEESALQELDRCDQLYPENCVVDLRRLVIYRRLSRHEEALEVCDRLIARCPYNVLFHSERAQSLSALGRLAEAAEERGRAAWLARWMQFRPNLVDRPEDGDVWVAGGWIAAEGEEWDAARACFAKAAELAPGREAMIAAGLAKVHLGRGEYDQAIVEAGRALEKATAFKQAASKGDETLVARVYGARVTRADSYLALGNIDAAISDYEAAGAEGETVAEAYRRQAERREAAGDTEGAAADREQARVADPFAGFSASATKAEPQ